MIEDTSDRNAAQVAGDLDAGRFQRQLQKDVRSWSASEAEGAERRDTVPDTARPDAASTRPVEVPGVRAKKVNKQAAGVATEVKPAGGKGRPFSMAYTP